MRYRESPVSPEFRPEAVYDYYVTGSGTFPFDMLRYDACWPAGPEDAAQMDTHSRQIRSIHMRSHAPPTIDRWSSFVWSVGTEKL